MGEHRRGDRLEILERGHVGAAECGTGLGAEDEVLDGARSCTPTDGILDPLRRFRLAGATSWGRTRKMGTPSNLSGLMVTPICLLIVWISWTTSSARPEMSFFHSAEVCGFASQTGDRYGAAINSRS